MKISQRSEIVEEITLNSDTVNQVTKRRLKQLVIPDGYLVTRKGVTNLCYDDPDWRHGSVGTIVAREATELDKAVFLILSAIE